MVIGTVKMTYGARQFEGTRAPMHVDDLDHEELLELDPEGGLIRFAG